MPRSNDPIVWTDPNTSASYKQQREKNYDDSINILQTQWWQADLDQRFYLGDQDLWGILYPGVSAYRRKMFNFNIINSIVQAVSGQQRQTRKSSVAIPTNPQGQKTADQLTRCLYYVDENTAGHQVMSQAFEQGALVQGIGLISI